MCVPDQVAGSECVGSSIPGSDKTIADCIRRSQRIEQTFTKLLANSCNKREISVDRISLASMLDRTSELVNFAENLHSGFGAPFQGWAAFVAEQLDPMRGWEVKADKNDENPFHANIRFPEAVVEENAVRQKYLDALTELSHWIPRRSVEHESVNG